MLPSRNKVMGRSLWSAYSVERFLVIFLITINIFNKSIFMLIADMLTKISQRLKLQFKIVSKARIFQNSS